VKWLFENQSDFRQVFGKRTKSRNIFYETTDGWRFCPSDRDTFMSAVTLVLQSTKFFVGRSRLVASCDLFAKDAKLAASAYDVRSPVSVDVFRQFLEAIQDRTIEVTDQNISSLVQLCEEFGFRSLSAKLLGFPSPPASNNQDARSIISALEERTSQQEQRIEALETKLLRLDQIEAEHSQMKMDLARLTSEVQTALLHLYPSSEAAQKQISRETLPIDHISPSDVEAMRQEVKRDLAFLHSEVAEIKKSTEEAKQCSR
jgi:hypothetical protein